MLLTPRQRCVLPMTVPACVPAYGSADAILILSPIGIIGGPG
ncbi:MAG: hypothetical protein AB1898_13635 [Acidobacteriota bacterium]